MFKRHLLKLAIGLAILASLIGGLSAESSAPTAEVAPAHPCWPADTANSRPAGRANQIYDTKGKSDHD